MRFKKSQVDQIVKKAVRRNSFRGGMLYLALGFLFGVFLSHSREISKWWYDETTKIRNQFVEEPTHPRYLFHQQGGLVEYR